MVHSPTIIHQRSPLDLDNMETVGSRQPRMGGCKGVKKGLWPSQAHVVRTMGTESVRATGGKSRVHRCQ